MRKDPVKEIEEDEISVTVEKKAQPTTGKKRMGRPKKAKEDLKNKQIPSYYTVKEHESIKRAAEAVGQTVGEFVRAATLEKLD